jgi:Raf kinase inhibitor-like YbhB/YbcL family protein
MKTKIGLALLIALPSLGLGLTQAQSSLDSASLKVTSRAFAPGGKIPKKYTCDGSNTSPPLHIDNSPKSAKSVVLIVEDPDAPGGTWTHWVLWNINPKATEISENSVPPDAIAGTNDFGNAKYGGPCPPAGLHRYYFKVYAVDIIISLPSSSKKAAVEKAMAGHIVAKGSLIGTYSREK